MSKKKGKTMDLTKRYETSFGVKCDILQLVRIEPEWAANIIQMYENEIKSLKDPISDQMDAMIMPRFNYYRKGDVMYISFGEPLPCIRTEVEDILIGRTPDGKLNGITIVDYKKKIALICS